MPVVWTDRHRLHEPKGEVWLGVWIEGTEVPARGDRIRAALEDAHASFVEPASYDEAPFEAVHDPALLYFLETAYDEWVAGGYLEEPGQDRVVPYVFPLPQLTPGRAPHRPAVHVGAHRDVRHGHDDADRSRHMGGGAVPSPKRR